MHPDKLLMQGVNCLSGRDNALVERPLCWTVSCSNLRWGRHGTPVSKLLLLWTYVTIKLLKLETRVRLSFGCCADKISGSNSRSEDVDGHDCRGARSHE